MVDLQKISQSQETLLDALARLDRGELPLPKLKPFSSPFGVYPQRNGKVMTRVRLHGGEITPQKLRFLSTLFAETKPDFAMFSTRQNVQVHGNSAAGAARTIRECTANGLPFRGGGGDTFRSVSVTPESGIADDGAPDLVPFAQFLAEQVFGWDEAFALPRKLKVGFSPSGNSVVARRQDLGFVAETDANGRLGFKVFGGGGLGKSPIEAFPLIDFIPAEKLVPATRAAVELFSENGNRKNRGEARLRFLRRAWGDDTFRARYVEYFEKACASGAFPSPPTFPHTRDLRATFPTENFDESAARTADFSERERADFEAWKKLALAPTRFGDDFVSVQIFVPDGRLTPDEFAQFTALIEWTGTPVVRLTFAKSAILPAVPVRAVPALYRRLKAFPIDLCFTSMLGRIVCCVGAATCSIGMLDTPKYAREVALRFDEFFRENPELRTARNVNAILDGLRFSGCPSSCSVHQAGKIGFQGWKKVIGGKPTEGFLLWQKKQPAADVAGTEDAPAGTPDEPIVGETEGQFVPAAELPDFVLSLARERLIVPAS